MGMTDDELADVLGRSLDSHRTGEGPEPEPVPPAQPAVVIVVGSFHWDNEAAVTEQLRSWWNGHGQPAVLLVTSGCPEGAEKHAREFGQLQGWAHSGLRDEELIQLPQAIAFVFIRDRSPGATRALEIIERSKIWHRVNRDETMRVVSPWAER